MKLVNAMMILMVSASILAAGCGGDKKPAGSNDKSIVNKGIDMINNAVLPYDYEGLKKAVYSTNKEERLEIAKKVNKQVNDATKEWMKKNDADDWKKKSFPKGMKELLDIETLGAVGAVSNSIVRDMPPTYSKIKLKDADYIIDFKKNVLDSNSPDYEIKGFFDVLQLEKVIGKDPSFKNTNEAGVISFVKRYLDSVAHVKDYYNPLQKGYVYKNNHGLLYAPHLQDQVGRIATDFDYKEFENAKAVYRSHPYIFNISKDSKPSVDFFVLFESTQGGEKYIGYIGNMSLTVVNGRLCVDSINVRKDSLNENPQFVFKIGNSRTSGSSNTATATDNQQGSIAANNILPTFHQAITAKQYRTAFNYLGQEMQNYVGGYDKFVNGYATTISSKVANMNTISSDSNNAVIEYILEAKDRINGVIVEQRFKGKATLKKIDGSWKIVETTAKKISYDTGGSVNSGQTGIITATEVRMRQYNNTNSEILGYFNKGERVTILSNVAGWYKVRRSDNSIGWVLGDFCKPQN